MEECKRTSNDRRANDRRMQSVSVMTDRRVNTRRSGLDRRDLLNS